MAGLADTDRFLGAASAPTGDYFVISISTYELPASEAQQFYVKVLSQYGPADVRIEPNQLFFQSGTWAPGREEGDWHAWGIPYRFEPPSGGTDPLPPTEFNWLTYYTNFPGETYAFVPYSDIEEYIYAHPTNERGGELFITPEDPLGDAYFSLGDHIVSADVHQVVEVTVCDEFTGECVVVSREDFFYDVFFVVRVLETFPPTLFLPQPVVAAAPDLAGAFVDFTVVATDAESGIAGISSNPPSGSFFTLGTTAVTSTASDFFGNKTTGIFFVTVEDKTPPTTTLRSIAGSAGPNGGFSGPVRITLNVQDGQSYGPTTFYQIDSGIVQTGTTVTVAAAGRHTVSYYSVDAIGNAELVQTLTFRIETIHPTVQSIQRIGPRVVREQTLQFLVTFSKPVTGVDVDDFTVTTVGSIPEARVISVTGSGKVYVVTVRARLGAGLVRLNLINNDSIRDLDGNSLGGPGAGIGDFYDGEWYVYVNPRRPFGLRR